MASENTTTKPGVLAVMDRVIDLERTWGDHSTANAMSEARDAVAELIAAAQVAASPSATDVEVFYAQPRLHAAIAKATGGQP